MLTLSVKRITLLLATYVMMTQGLYAQQTPQYSLYPVNSYLFNPAVGGIESYIDLKLGHRTQWNGIPGSPKSNYMSIHAPIDRSSYKVITANPRKSESNRRTNHTNKAISQHHSIGGFVQQDQTGNFERYEFNLSYSYHLPLNARYTLSMGMSGGFISRRIDQESVKVVNDLDPTIAGASEGVMNPTLNIGFWLYSNSFFIGASGVRLIESRQSFLASEVENDLVTKPSFFLISGYRFTSRSADIQYIPSLMVRYQENTPSSLEASLTVILDQRVWLGGIIKTSESAAFYAGLALGSTFDLTYSYDFSLINENLSRIAPSTHEVVFGIRLKNKYKVTCKQNLW